MKPLNGRGFVFSRFESWVGVWGSTITHTKAAKPSQRPGQCETYHW